jgi:hypothetical protein
MPWRKSLVRGAKAARVRFSARMPLPENIDGLSPAELKSLALKLLEEMAELRGTIAAQRDEIARLKGGPPRPNIKPNSKPSGMEQATDSKPSGSSNEPRRRGSTRSKLSIDETRTVTPTVPPPPGSCFKGYTSFVVQDLVLRLHVVDSAARRGFPLRAPADPGRQGRSGSTPRARSPTSM